MNFIALQGYAPQRGSGTVSYVSPSSNRPVVMVHGFAGSFASTWENPGIAQLVRDCGRDVLAVDLLGHGSAPKPHDPAAYADLTERVFDVIPDGAQVDAVGFSMGAITLLGAIIKNPGAFHCVILAGIGDGVFERQPREHRERIASGIKGTADPDDKYARQFGHYASQNNNDIDALSALFLRPDRDPLKPEELSHFTGRVLVVIGDRDEAFPAEKLAQAFPNGAVKVLKGVDHFATPEDFGFIDALLQFLETDV